MTQSPFRPRKKRSYNEEREQTVFVTWLAIQYPNIMKCTIPNDAKRGVVAASAAKRMGMTAGAPDLFIFQPHTGFHGLAIEFKYGKNKLSRAQLSFLTGLVERGYAAAVCWSYEDARNAFEDYFSNNMPAGIINYYRAAA